MRYVLLILTIWMLGSPLSALSQSRPFPMAERTLLWKIEGKKVRSDSYLFGTIHLIDKELFYFPPSLDSLVRKSDQLVMEIADLHPQDALSYLTLKEGSFFDYFSPEQTDTILNWAASELDMEPQKFRLLMGKMKPFVVVQMVAQLSVKGETESYELTFQRMAKEAGTKTIGLETVADQIQIFDDLDSTDQREMVMGSIRDFAESDSIMHLMERTYLNQDLDSMYLLIAASEGTIGDMQEQLLDERNANWVPRITKLIRSEDTFIAVGAGHLGGPKGVIRLLEEEGYTLTPVYLTPPPLKP